MRQLGAQHRETLRAGDNLAEVLCEEVAVRGSKRGYVGGELGWTLEDNELINAGIARMGAKHYKTYRVFQKSL